MFASFRLLAYLIEEMDQVAPQYFADLKQRFDYGDLNAQGLRESDPEYDGAWPIDDFDRKGVTFMDPVYAVELYDQLFPHTGPEADVRYLSNGAVITGFHASLEVYAKALGADLRRRPLTTAVRDLLRDASPPRDLDPDSSDALLDLDQTRHLLIHNRGVVTEQYANAVKGNQLILGELRPLDHPTIERLAHVTWTVARLMKAAAQ